MISTLEAPNREAVIHFLSSLRRELRLLEDLRNAAAQARTTSPDEESGEGLQQILERQTEMCAELEVMRRQRIAILAEDGYRVSDLLVVVLGALPKDDHPEVIDLFKQYVDVAEATQREIDVNREFFSVALATLEDTIGAVISTVKSRAVYDAKGSSLGDGSTALCVSTMT